jgi:hypothetical protein
MLAIPGGAVGISVLGRADIADDDAIAATSARLLACHIRRVSS